MVMFAAPECPSSADLCFRLSSWEWTTTSTSRRRYSGHVPMRAKNPSPAALTSCVSLGAAVILGDGLAAFFLSSCARTRRCIACRPRLSARRQMERSHLRSYVPLMLVAMGCILLTTVLMIVLAPSTQPSVTATEIPAGSEFGDGTAARFDGQSAGITGANIAAGLAWACSFAGLSPSALRRGCANAQASSTWTCTSAFQARRPRRQGASDLLRSEQ